MAGMIPTFGPPRGAYTGGLPAVQGFGQGYKSPAQAGAVWGQPQQAPQGGYQQMGQRPQMMADALMGAPPGSIPQQLGNTGNWGYATPEQQAANRVPATGFAAYARPQGASAPLATGFGGAQPMPPGGYAQMGQAAAQQAQPAMARPVAPSRGMARA